MPPTPQASTEAAARVDTVGRRLLASNPGIGAKPMFTTIGSPQPEVFHRSTHDLFITEGLVKQCDESQLAAVLSLELAKMVREREAATPVQQRTREPMPPIDSRFGRDDMMGGIPDHSDLREMQQYDADRKARRGAAKLPDPPVLAREYLARSGYQPDSLTSADAVLHAAGGQNRLERQMVP